MRISEKAYAKLNLSLDVLSRMDDGYHSMLMVLQTADFCDDLCIEASKGEGISLKTNLCYLPCDERNIAFRAADLFLRHAGITGYHISIEIDKRIPICAGLGGGSADGAAVLRALNSLFKTDIPCQELEFLAEQLGSDVPFCVAGGTALATGRGCTLEALPEIPDCRFVICKPAFSVSTPELFSRLDCRKIKCRPDTSGMIDALTAGSLAGVARRMYNVFEPVLVAGADRIAEIKESLLDSGALGTVMTGTGSAVFGIFSDDDTAARAIANCPDEYGQCFAAKPIGRISEN